MNSIAKKMSFLEVSEFIYHFISHKMHIYFNNKAKNSNEFLTFKWGSKRIYILNEPEAIEDFFKFGTRSHRGPLQKIIGNGLFSDGTNPQSRSRRKLLQGIFTPLTKEYIERTINTSIKNGVKSLLDENIDLLQSTKMISIKTNINIVLGPTNEANLTKLSLSLDIILDYIDFSLFSIFSITSNKRKNSFIEAKKVIFNYVENVFNGDITCEPKCLLIRMIESSKDNHNFTLDNIKDEVLSLLGSGVETAGALYFWLLKTAIDNPGYLNNKYQTTDYSTSSNTQPEIGMNKKIELFIHETLRLYPAAWAMIRYFDQDITLAGKEIKANSFIWVSPCLTHFDARYWHEPLKFDPMRFMNNQIKGAFFPFAKGTHQCFGQYLAISQFSEFVREINHSLDLKRSKIEIIRTNSRLALIPTQYKFSIYSLLNPM